MANKTKQVRPGMRAHWAKPGNREAHSLQAAAKWASLTDEQRAYRSGRISAGVKAANQRKRMEQDVAKAWQGEPLARAAD